MALYLLPTQVPEYRALNNKEKKQMFRSFKSKFMTTPMGFLTLGVPLIGLALGIGIVKALGLDTVDTAPVEYFYAGFGTAGMLLSSIAVPFMLSFGFARFIRQEQERLAILEEKRAKRAMKRASVSTQATFEEDHFEEPVLGSTPDPSPFA